MSSVEQFYRTLSDRYNTFKQHLDSTISAFGLQNREDCAKAAGRLSGAGTDLLSILTEVDRPPWLKPITEAANDFARSKYKQSGETLLKTIATRYRSIQPIELPSDTTDHSFDKLYDHLRSQGKLPELFGEMMNAIQQMLDSGAIDSATVIEALRKLLRLLKANQNGSYVAVLQTFKSATFIKTTLIEYLKAIPVIAPIAKGYEKAVQQTGEALDDLDQELRNKSLNLFIDQTIQHRLNQLVATSPLQLEPLPLIEHKPNDGNSASTTDEQNT